MNRFSERIYSYFTGFTRFIIHFKWVKIFVICLSLDTLVAVFILSSVAEGTLTLPVRKHVLANGMKFLILERHQAPVFSAYLRYNVGSVDEQVGMTGSAHFLEHLMFKGTKQLGSCDYDQEQTISQEIENVVDSIESVNHKNGETSYHSVRENGQDDLKELKDRLAQLQLKAGEYIVENEIWQIYQKNGAVGLNASTGHDSTQYYVSLPANKLELWFFLESDRLADPVFREFYSERNVILEERRLRYENNPYGKLREAFYSTAFMAHPYQWPVIGWSSDLAVLRKKDVRAFFNRYYAPNNAVAVNVINLSEYIS